MSQIFFQSDKSQPLKAPDAILHPNIENFISDFFEEDGEISDLIEFLSNGYVGMMHKVDIIGTIMSKHGYNFQEMLNAFISKKVIQLFEIRKFDTLVSDPENIPEWVNMMTNSEFWCQSILSLLKRYPESQFVQYCFTKICNEHPEYVKEIPRRSIQLRHFKILFAYYSCNLTAENEKIFIDLITTDDRTVIFAAKCLDTKTQSNFINKVEIALSKDHSLLQLFQRVLMRMDGWCDEAIKAYFAKVMLMPEHIQMFKEYVGISAYSKDHAIRKITCSLLDKNVPKETTKEIVQYLIEQEGELGESDLSDIVKGVRVIKKWEFVSKNHLRYALNSIKHYIIAKNTLTVVNRMIKSKKVTVTSYDSTPEVDLLLGIYYWHPSLRQRSFDIFKKLFALDDGKNLCFRQDLYNGMRYIFYYGKPIEVLELMSDPRIPMDGRRIISFFVSILPNLETPFSQLFVEKLARALNSKKVKEAFFLPVSQVRPNIQALSTLKNFIERANRNNACKLMSKEAVIFDDLRSRASKLINFNSRK